MNHFYVLRNNREAGPFTLAELKTYGLLSTDLIWIDGESKGWKHPSEIEGLKAVTLNEPKGGVKPKQNVKPAQNESPQPALPQPFIAGKEFYTAAAQEEALRAGQSKTVFRRAKKRSTVPSYAVGTRLFGAIVLLIGGLLCGFVVVNLLKQFDEKPAAVSQAVELNAKAVPASPAPHTAEAPPSSPPSSTPPLIASVTQKKDTVMRKPLVVNPPETTAPGTAKAKPQNVKKTAKKTPTPRIAVVPEPAAPEPVEEKPEPPKPEKAPPSLQLSANDYKVGLFGGVSNLEITVSNPSGQSVAKAVIEIEYLKPNGNVVRTQTVSAENIAAGGSKIVPVPSSGRGVKVRYHVVSVE